MPQATPQPGSAVPWLWALTLITVVGGAAVAGYILTRPDESAPGATQNLTAAPEPTTVPLGRDYYVYVKLVELRPTLADGEPWDSWTGTAPDPFYRMTWQGGQVHESTTRDDAFVAGWDLLSVDFKDVLLRSGGEVDVESVVNAPVIHITQGTTVTVEIIDDDTFDNTEAGTITLKLDRFHVGENVLTFTETQQPLIARIVVGIVDRALSLPELLEAVSQR